MSRDPYKNWLVENLNRPGFSQTGLATALGLHPSAINKVVKGKRLLKSQEIADAASYFGVALPSIGAAAGDGLFQDKLVGVIIAGQAEAGAFREVDDLNQSEPEMLSLPPDIDFPNARQFAVTVSGDSMNQLKPRPILSGDRVVCLAFEDIEKNISLRDGMVVLVERTRDGGHTREWSIKQLELYDGRTEFHPRTSNNRHKPIVVKRDTSADEGLSVEIIGIVRRIINDIPLF
ncbi:MAG: XRE family transcriptional regulator [Rhizobiaceae bacterium]|nr:XRE family transcriptional regulator [Rhizobiaceae bacterium]